LSGYLKLKKRDSTQIIKGRLFPYNTKKYDCKNRIVLIGVGGNLGDCKRRYSHLFWYLKREKILKIVATSVIYKNPPFGYLNQPFFYNTLILIETKLKPLELLRYTQRVEKHFKRKREFKDSPRTLDLDIILYEKIKFNKVPTLIIPHLRWKERESVLLPLKYLKGVRCLKRVL